MCYGATAFDQDVNGWDVSRVTNMGLLFHSATTFNVLLGDWQVQSVTNFSSMFEGASSFSHNMCMDPWGSTFNNAGVVTTDMFANTGCPASTVDPPAAACYSCN